MPFQGNTPNGLQKNIEIMEIRPKICFVIMGFGRKTDFETGKTFDLNKTYNNIIKPAVIEAGYECIRADEVNDSGLIDKSMYALLIRAELVIADISTFNPNAIYELGVRHAVRPYSTIIIQEKEGKTPFDINHNRIFKYAHLGEDIGFDEVKRCQTSLTSLIIELGRTNNIDSPLYEFFTTITPPILTDEEYRLFIDTMAKEEKLITAIVEKAIQYVENSDFINAAIFWEKAHKKSENEPYYIQQWALAKYKSRLPSEELALIDALNIINKLNPDGNTNDPETLGITGAIYKKLWFLNEGNESYLDRAIQFYRKCFNIREDYYNGENYALCLDIKSSVQTQADEMIFYKIQAKKIREKMIVNLNHIIEMEDFGVRSDKKWIYATLSATYFGLKDVTEHQKFEEKFLQENIADWEKETYYLNKSILSTLLN